MRDFTFSSRTKVIFGQGTAPALIPELQAANIKRVLIHTGGRSVYASGLYSQITGLLDQAGIAWETVSGVQPNPRLDKIREAIMTAREMRAEAVLAIGGGSVFDSAKAVAVGVPAEHDIWVMTVRKLPVTVALPVYGILTLSGTSSEVNGTSMISNEETHEKFMLSDPKAAPVVSVVDPALQFTVPHQLVLSAGLDALSHVLEAYFEGMDTSPIIYEGCESYARNIIRCLRKLAAGAPASFDDYNTRSELAFNSVWAHSGWASLGRAVRGDFSSHKIAHAMGALYDVTHGIAMGIIMPAWMRYMYSLGLGQESFTRLATHVFELTEADSNDLGLAGSYVLRDFVKSIGLPTTLGEVRIAEDDIPKLAEIAAKELPFGCVKCMDTDAITQVLRYAL